MADIEKGPISEQSPWEEQELATGYEVGHEFYRRKCQGLERQLGKLQPTTYEWLTTKELLEQAQLEHRQLSRRESFAHMWGRFIHKPKSRLGSP